MRLILAVAFGLLVFASVAWGQDEEDKGEVVGEYGSAGHIRVLEPEEIEETQERDIDEDSVCEGSGECGPIDTASGFDVATGELGSNSHATLDVNQSIPKPLENGFDVATGSIGSGVPKAVTGGDAGKLEIVQSGFDVFTGEIGLPTRKIECTDRPLTNISTSYGENYHVLYNVSPMTEMISCGETVTYATFTDVNSLTNLSEIIDSWRAPMSISLDVSGTDLRPAIEAIRALKSCSNPLISRFVSFHLYWHKNHQPRQIREALESLSQSHNCEDQSWVEITRYETNSLQDDFVNSNTIGYNIAKKAAITHYIMVAEYGMYSSANLASEFIKMITRNNQEELESPNPKAFVIMMFRSYTDDAFPIEKNDLISKFYSRTIFFDHTGGVICEAFVPPLEPQWMEEPVTDNLRVSEPLKRNGTYQSWNPVFIATDDAPDFDTRMSISAIRTRNWLLCAQDYEFLILNNAFLVGKERRSHQYFSSMMIDALAEDTRIMQNVILPEYHQKYGRDKGCVM